MTKRFLVTGGAGFIGSAFVRHVLAATEYYVLVLDKLTYAGNLESLAPVKDHPRFKFVRADIADAAAARKALVDFQPDVVLHLAAESHVDRSIDGPAAFVQTNMVGTFVLLQQALAYWRTLPKTKAEGFRFHHVSTDEVFGSLDAQGLFNEDSPYRPNSPYSASKAASDHLVRAWHHTYGLPVVISNCSNNFGPCHFPEKLIPLTILNALEESRCRSTARARMSVTGSMSRTTRGRYCRSPSAAASARATMSEPIASGRISRSCARSAR